ncbi:hypothetical protein HD806DRAFT_526447 [Xylariaceae sp. AK1471]|nr:hypothetical protein HD806DRAFT_526447 [Xylariaceae sp. AK1471]
MCRKTGSTSQKLPSPIIQLTELKAKRSITCNTPLVATPSGTIVAGECENDRVAKAHNLKSFSAFRDDDNPFQGLRTLIYETWERYTNIRIQPVGTQTGFGEDFQCVGEELLARTFVVSEVVSLQECRNDACERRRCALEKAVPQCGWLGLEALVLRSLACWQPNFIHLLLDILLKLVPDGGKVIMRPGVETFKGGARHLVYDVESLPRVVCVDLTGIVDLCRWGYRVAYGVNWIDHLRNFGVQKGGYNRLEGLLFNLNPQYEAKALSFTQACRLWGMCLYRLWNVCLLSASGLADIPQIASIALDQSVRSALQSDQHRDCTEESCLLSHQNSTSIEQQHKCEPASRCQVTVFPKEDLNQAFEKLQKTGSTSSHGAAQHNSRESSSQRSAAPSSERDAASSRWIPSAWRTGPTAPSLCHKLERYMAISHVWADGTGERRTGSGEANSCLVEYFTNIAQGLGCSGIWWDAICLPTGSAKTAAIDTMLLNYENATVTLVHDEALVNLDWSKDGSPAVALVLSSWFTRGWTAAELFASRGHPVKVLFRNPKGTNGLPLVKDLDDDILAWEPGAMGTVDDVEVNDEWSNYRADHLLDRADMVARHGHFIASDIIRRLRGTVSRGPPMSSLRDLLLNLRARVTSWEKDRYIIPGLMCLRPFDSTATGPQVTRQLLTHFGTISCSDLFHGQVPVRPFGPWSWCPPSIFDLSVSQNSLSGHPSAECRVSQAGLLYGAFTAYSLAKSDVVLPFGRHPAVSSRVAEALGERDSCLLLADRNDKAQSHRQYILACPLWVGWLGGRQVVSCRWAGCIYLGRGDPLEPAIVITGPLEIEYINARFNPKASRDVRYIFGADLTDHGQPLPTMSAREVTTILRGYDNASFNDRGSFQWAIGKQVEQRADDVRWQREALPICFYPLDAAERADHSSQRIQSYIVATIDEASDHDAIAASLMVKVMDHFKVKSSLQACHTNHTDCAGVVELAWSFPPGPIRDQSVRRRIFRTPFHIMRCILDSNGQETGMCIGWLTYSKDIAPRCIRTRGHGEDEGSYLQMFMSSITEGSEDSFDWEKSLEDLPPCHQRRGVRGDTKTFDGIFGRPQNEEREQQVDVTRPSRYRRWWKREGNRDE